MKYFRKHPDVLVIASYPSTVVRVLKSTLRSTKKILLLTDAAEEETRAGFIMKTVWKNDAILSFGKLLHRLTYNHQTQAVAIVYHARLFGSLTAIVTPVLLLLLRISRKRIVLIFLSEPTVSTKPTIAKAIWYILRVTFHGLIGLLSTVVVQPLKLRTRKERNAAGKLLADELFPSPIKNLGLVNMLSSEHT